MNGLPAVWIVFAGLLDVCYAELLPKAGFNCTAQKTCGACVAESPECHWCKAPGYSSDRCNHWTLLNQTNCTHEHIVSPESEITNMKNEEPRNAKLPTDTTQGSPPIQLAPQEIRIKLRPNKPFQFKMKFRQAENYPVDIYFIMDVSNTMKLYKQRLSNFSHELVAKIGNITTDFRLGFGSFVDKATLPFVTTGMNNEVLNPCTNCSLPYGFKNELSLTRNENEFKKRVEGLRISGNLDAPEGGFDAIMQAIVCMKEIGWREQSRKMILFSTDGSFHYAGDGKLGGIVIPNDGHCHLTADGYYSESVNQDYPSISQLAQKISEKKVNVIFMIPESQVALYRRLSDHVLGSNVGPLTSDFSNVIDLVQENYNRIRSTIQLQTENLDGENVKIEFKVKCPRGEVRTFPECGDLGVGESVSFNVSVIVHECPRDRSQWNKTFQISPVGLTEKLMVHLDLICECPCQGDGIQNSPMCNRSGIYECGICTCYKGFYGKHCECGAASTEEDPQYDKPCRLTNTSEVCQGKGRCECGQCVCNPINPSDPGKRYSGSHCECNDYSCDYHQNKICGGPSRGACKCGKCQCIDNYSGVSCNCLKSTTQCEVQNGPLCNGKGNCTCGVCECIDEFKGPKCEDCPQCPGKCEANRPCVECLLREKDEKCKGNCSMTSLVDDFTTMPDWRDCLYRDEDQCDIRFIYHYKTNEVKVKRKKECVHRTSDLVIILSVIGTVIAAGIIALLIWKVFVTVHDQREYKAFVDEQSKARWDVAQNPVYKPATTNFQNPTYRPGSTINH